MAKPDGNRFLVCVGSFAQGGCGGIYACALDAATGQLHHTASHHQLDQVLFLKRHPARPQFLYAAQHRSDAEGIVATLAIDGDGTDLRLLSEQASGGHTPCYLDITDELLLLANYGSGSVAMLPINDDGTLQPPCCVRHHQPTKQSAEPGNQPHAHAVIVDPTGRFALASELGMGDLRIYRLNVQQQRLIAHDPPAAGVHAGAGPRHLAFAASGKHLYLINEHDASLYVFQWDSKQAALTPIQQLSTLPAGITTHNHAADLHVHPSGRFVYVSNRGHDSITVLAVDQGSGRLDPIQHEPTQGKFPRAFTLAPDGTLLVVANEQSDNLVTFRVDRQTGRLSATGHTLALPAPVCFAWLG